MIVITHISYTISKGSYGELLYLSENFYNANLATSDIQHLIIGLFYHGGPWGNIIFFTCSFWFLSNSKKPIKVNKILQMVMNVWLISVIYLLVIGQFEVLSIKYVIKCLLPNIFGNNWFITCYLMVYAIHPILNKTIEAMDQKSHASFCLITVLLYNGIVFLKPDLLYSSRFVQTLVLYFLVAYVRKYMSNLCKNTKANLALLVVTVLCIIGMYLLTNYLGLHYSVFSGKALRWTSSQYNNPFMILSAIALFNLFSKLKFSSKAVNYISGLSMLIYLIHENILFRTYTRVRIWSYLLDAYGDGHLVLMTVIFAVVLFIAAIIVSIIYKNTLQKLVRKVEERVEPIIVRSYDRVLNTVMKIN